MYTPARFIVLEGIDGSGTTTQAALLTARLKRLQLTVTQTAEPSQGAVGSQCRALLQAQEPPDADTLALMFAADRMDHVARCIRPALGQGHAVVCDRYVLSTLAYQGLTLPEPWLWAINSRSLTPHITVFLDAPTQEAQRRVSERAGISEIFDAAPVQERVAARYRHLVAQSPQGAGPIVTVDALGSQEDVAARIWQQLQPLVSGATQNF